MGNIIKLFDWKKLNSKLKLKSVNSNNRSMPSDTIEILEGIFEDVLGIPNNVTFSENTTREDLWMDSLDNLASVMAIECNFKIDIKDTEWDNCVTVGDMVKLIESKL
ncbi:acyl carrier protein-like protein [Vibrio phage 1.161.O._10N.261.48.C5]|nr:acyl carrier protein-like protein [Vibrio phage 1.161.O._10N.261.48.C5]